MTLIETIKTQKFDAMRSKNKILVSIIDVLMSKLQNATIDVKRDLTIVEEFKLVKSLKSQTEDELDALQKAGRNTDDVKSQLMYLTGLFEALLEKQPRVKSKQEVEAEVDQLFNSGLTSMKDLMSEFKAHADQYDMKLVSEVVRAKLS